MTHNQDLSKINWTIDTVILKPEGALKMLHFYQKRTQELLEANGRYLERARLAEASEDPYQRALSNLNSAAYDAIRSCKDTVQYPDVNRQKLREICSDTDKLVDGFKIPQRVNLNDSGIEIGMISDCLRDYAGLMRDGIIDMANRYDPAAIEQQADAIDSVDGDAQ